MRNSHSAIEIVKNEEELPSEYLRHLRVDLLLLTKS